MLFFHKILFESHIDYFETNRYDDEYAYARLFNETHINTRDASKMFDLICKKLLYSKNFSNFLSILNHLLLATCKLASKIDRIRLVEKNILLFRCNSEQ